MRNNVLAALRVSGRLALDRLLVDDAPGLHFEHLPDPRTRRSWRTTGSDDGGRVSAARYVEGISGVPRPSRALGLGEPPREIKLVMSTLPSEETSRARAAVRRARDLASFVLDKARKLRGVKRKKMIKTRAVIGRAVIGRA